MSRPMTPAAQTSEPRTADCFHRVVHGLTNWVDDGKGNTVPDGCYWYCYDCGVPFRPEAALPTSPDVVEARDVLLRWARGFGPTQVIYDGDRRVGSVREVVERALAALPAAAPAPLDVERLEAAYDRHFDAPDHYDECGSACFQTFMAAYAATDPDAKEAGE